MSEPVSDLLIAPEIKVDETVPWSVRDAWVGLGLLIIIQILIIAAVFIFKPVKIYGSFAVILLEGTYLIPVVIILARRRINWKLLGYRKFTSTNILMGCGLLVVAYFIVIINNTIFLMFGKNTQAEGIARLLGSLPSPYAFVISGVLLAPFVEETFFRGFLFPGFRQRYGWKVAALLSSAFFAAMHLQLSALIPTFVLGYVFSILYQRSNSILPGMLMHFLVNAFGFSAIYFATRFGGFIPR
jgi:uncharacterized protein